MHVTMNNSVQACVHTLRAEHIFDGIGDAGRFIVHYELKPFCTDQLDSFSSHLTTSWHALLPVVLWLCVKTQPQLYGISFFVAVPGGQKSLRCGGKRCVPYGTTSVVSAGKRMTTQLVPK